MPIAYTGFHLNHSMMYKLISIIGLAAIVFTSCQHQEHTEQENSKFVVTQPEQKDTLIYQKYVCQVRSIQHIELRALEKGYLQHIYVDEGQAVKRGQLLFRIQPIIYQAETEKALAEVHFAEIEYSNTKKLADSNIVSQNELALIKAKLEKARAELSLAQAHLGFTEIKAPFDGIVGRFNNVRLGSLLDEGELLTTLSDNSKMWVYFNVPEAEYLNYMSHKAKSDTSIKVKLQMANNELFNLTGTIETIEADFNNETGNIAFRAGFQNSGNLLRNGETGNILMPVQLNKALLVPQEATFEVLDKKYVYVIGTGNKVESRQVTTGVEMPHLYQVTEGLTAADKILVEGLRKVHNGQQISYEQKPMQQVLAGLQQLHAE
jgi:membrane fusion protein, multidrug efflux system